MDEELKGCSCGCTDQNCDDDITGCGCGCGCEDEGEFMSVDLEDEDGNIVTCQIIDGFDYKNSEYAIVQNPENGAVYLFKVIGEEEGELVVPDEDEFDEVSAYYEEIVGSY